MTLIIVKQMARFPHRFKVEVNVGGSGGTETVLLT